MSAGMTIRSGETTLADIGVRVWLFTYVRPQPQGDSPMQTYTRSMLRRYVAVYLMWVIRTLVRCGLMSGGTACRLCLYIWSWSWTAYWRNARQRDARGRRSNGGA